MAKQTFDYSRLSAELDTLLLELQIGELDIDLAIGKYERGLEILKLLESHLKDAENTVRKLRQRDGDETAE